MRAPKHVTGPRRSLFRTQVAELERRVPVLPNTPAGVTAVPSWGMDYGRAHYVLALTTNKQGQTQYQLIPNR